MPTVKQVLYIARSELGYIEGQNNNNKYGRNLNLNYVSWCALFVLDCLINAGFTGYKKLYLKYAYCPTWANDFKKQKLNVSIENAQPGDIVFYNFHGKKYSEHVGIIEDILSIHIIAIEGNTGSLSQNEGDGVFRKTRHKSLITAIGRPPYSL